MVDTHNSASQTQEQPPPKPLPEMSSNKKVPISNSSSYSSDDQLASDLRAALVSNGSIPTIQESLHNELQRTGWAANLRAYVTQLMRSGECTNYDQLMEKVLHEALDGLNGPDKVSNGANGHSDPANPGLKIPDSVKERGVKVVEREIAKVADIDESLGGK